MFLTMNEILKRSGIGDIAVNNVLYVSVFYSPNEVYNADREFIDAQLILNSFKRPFLFAVVNVAGGDCIIIDGNVKNGCSK
jgi:hypothetical protein